MIVSWGVTVVHITLKEALSIYPLSEAKLVAGERGAARVIRSINIMDAPDIADWIKPGELLFTTAYLLKDDLCEVTTLMRKLHERGGVGLGIKLGRYWHRIPQRALDEADRIGFPLLELPFQFTFSDQMNALFQAEHERNTRRLQSVLDRQKKLIRLAFGNVADGELFAAVEDVLGNPVAVVGESGQLFYNSSAWPEAALTMGMPWKNANRWIRSEHGAAYRVPLSHCGECCGFLYVMSDSPVRLKAEEGLYRQAAELLSHYLGRGYEEYVRRTRHDEFGSLMIRYLEGKLSVGLLLEHGAQKMAFADGSYQCVLTALPEEAGGDAGAKIMRQIRQEARYHPVLRKYRVQHFDLPEGVFSVYSLKAKAGGDDPDERLVASLRKIGGGDAKAPRFFVSRVKRKPDALREAYHECLEARRLSRRFGLQDAVVLFETVEFASVFQYVPQEVMRAYCDRILHALTARETASAEELLKTLECYIRNDGQVHKVAKSLHIHRNTVAYRLEKAGEMLNLNLNRLDDMLKLKMVFVFRQLTEDGKTG